MVKKDVTIQSAAEMMRFGQRIGSGLRGGEIIRLIGDVGAGKTTLVRGVVDGINSKDHVSSPTFTVHKKYTGRVDVYHYDFYRVQNDQAIARELAELAQEPRTCVVIEWPEYAALKLPVEPIDITIDITGEDQRSLTLTIPEKASYIKLP
jgi:tRNA threonylcarbamoyladenosine biosynthesis protein TsaE